jgi:hypothetical protein
MGEEKKNDFIEGRGVLFNIFVYLLIWYLVDALINWIWQKYDIHNDLVKAGILFLIVVVLLAIAYCRHYNIFFVALVPSPPVK